MPTDDDAVRDKFNDLARLELADAIPQPMCECKCTGDKPGAPPHADEDCRRAATVLVRMHWWGECDKAAADPHGDLSGNIVAVMCQRCALYTEQLAKAKIIQLRGSGHPMQCPTCSRNTVTWQDILREAQL